MTRNVYPAALSSTIAMCCLVAASSTYSSNVFADAPVVADAPESLEAHLARPRGVFPTLAQVIERARTRGPAALLASAEIKVASSSRVAAGLPPLTNPYLEVFVDRAATSGAVTTIQSNLWLPIELAGQKDRRIGEVDALLRWKEVTKIAAGTTCVGDAVAAYGETLVASVRVQEAATGEKVAREEAAYVAGRFSVGDATLVMKAAADGEIGRWVQTKGEAALELELSRTRLSIAIGDANLGLPAEDVRAELPALRWKDEVALATHVVSTSPSLRAADEEAKFHKATREKWDADKYAPVNFIVSFGRGDAAEFRYGGGLSWTFPVLRKNQAEIARADAEMDRVAATRAIDASALEARARGYFRAYNVARSALTSIDAISIPAAQALVDAALAEKAAGKGELSRVFLARRDLATARQRRLDIIAAGLRTYGALAGLIGQTP